MSKKGGLFGFFKKDEPDFSEEEKFQRDYARQKEQEAKNETASTPAPSEPEEIVDPVSDEIVSFCQSKLDELLRLSHLFGQTEVRRNNNNVLSLEIINAEDLARVIGKDGSTLSAFQTLLRSFVYNKFGSPIRVYVDAGNYKKKKTDSIKEKAIRVAKKVQQTGKAFELDPMNALERRQVHLLFEKDATIHTFSAGEGRDRHIVISKK